jgi:quercetin dioxygenase-like cupin family protein
LRDGTGDYRGFSMAGKGQLRKSVWRLLSGFSVFAWVAVGFAGGQWAAAREPLPRITPILESGTTVVGEAIHYPRSAPAKVTAAVLALQPGDETGWHTHGVPAFGYVLEGELTVDYGDKGQRVYKTGDAVLEAMSIAHNGRNTGNGVMRILAVFMGAEGVANSVKRDKASGQPSQTP